MSKKQFKSQASSTRAVSGALSSTNEFLGGSLPSRPFASGPSSALSYVYEPPDLTEVDPNLAVIYKSLQKKDSVTKVKALEDLKAYASSPDIDVEDVQVRDGLLEPWIKLYPRTSIDTSQRVRLLAHAFQGQISTLLGKRIAKSLPRSIGAWICGQYDNDRGVARSASDALKQVFPSEEKLANVWRVYLPNILEFCRDAITKESVQTLSDERITSPDEAAGKYARVISTSVSALQHVLTIIPEGVVEDQASIMDDLLRSKQLWKLATNPDLLIRRSIYRLLKTAIQTRKDVLDMSMLSRHLVSSGLRMDQTGSDVDYMIALSVLTSHFPSVWTDLYAGKKTATASLVAYLEKANPGMQSSYWISLGDLLQHVPSDLLKSTNRNPKHESTAIEPNTDVVYPILEALRDCISRQARLRADQELAWTTYLDTVAKSLDLISDEQVKEFLISSHVVPEISGYLNIPYDTTNKNVAVKCSSKVPTRAFRLMLQHSPLFANRVWQNWSTATKQAMQTSQPEQAKAYQKSQDDLGATLERWYSLTAQLRTTDSIDSLEGTDVSTLAQEAQVMFDVLIKRSGKPYGVAIGLRSMISDISNNTTITATIQQSVSDFLRQNLATLMTTPSSVYLIDILHNLSGEASVHPLYQAALQGLTKDNDEVTIKAMKNLLRAERFYKNIEPNDLELFLEKKVQAALDGNDREWDVIDAALSSPGLSPELKSKIMPNILTGLNTHETQEKTLRGLSLLIEHHSNLFESDIGPHSAFESTCARLLEMVEVASEDIARNAENIWSSLSKKASRGDLLSMMKAISAAVMGDEQIPSIDNLINRARNILIIYKEAGHDMEQAPPLLLPTEQQWSNIMAKLMECPPYPSLAVTGTLDVLSFAESPEPLSRQYQRRLGPQISSSILTAARAVGFIASLLNLDFFTLYCDHVRSVHTLHPVLLFNSIIEAMHNDGSLHLMLPSTTKPTDVQMSTHQNAISCIDLMAELVSWDVRGRLWKSSEGSFPASYYSAQAYSFLTSYITTLIEDGPDLWKRFRKCPHIFQGTQGLRAWRDDGTLLKICNELIADLTGLNLEQQPLDGLRLLAMLDASLENRMQVLVDVPRQRLVFLVKHLVKLINTAAISRNLKASTARVLVQILPQLRDHYESFWEDLVTFILQSWRSNPEMSDYDAPLLHASMKLCSKLRALVQMGPECNDDLKDALAADAKSLDILLINLLPKITGTPADISPWKAIHNEVATLALGINVPPEETFNELYLVLNSQSISLQEAAYNILHLSIIANQEDVSMEKALTKLYVAQLSGELITMLLNAPDPEIDIGPGGSGVFHPGVHGYLLSWMLVFDHWTNSSQRVQEDYVKAIEEGSYLGKLLHFTYELLVDGRSQLPNASKYDVTTCMASSNPKLSIERQLAHLYYLSLRHLPTIVRSWWQDTASRQAKLTLESWTEKYFTPHLIADEFAAITAWIPTQEDPSADHPLEVRTLLPAREITATIPVDETTMRIAIRFPPAYPLTRPTVETIHRVGVTEQKWRTWTLNTQGVINFSRVGGSGAIIDGLTAWKKNVTAKLKGQSECAICYSVVSADKQLPSKKCGTCGNMFHGACLFRWFKSSNSSSCPLCRNPFHYA